MATYLELSNLSVNADFLARVAYAVGKYAAYIENEAADATDHAKRMNWAAKAKADSRAMAVSMIYDICQNADVVYGLAAVTDASLQTAVETAANADITAPIGYADLMNLATDAAFLRRLQICVAKFSMYILNEAPSVPNHNARYTWAKTAVLQSTFVAQTIAPAVVVNDVVSAKLASVSDAELQAAVEAEAQQLLL